MKALIFLVLLAVIAYAVYVIVTSKKEWPAGRMAKRKPKVWAVEPRTLPSGERQLWLVCDGEDDYLQWNEAVFVDRVGPTQWEAAIYEAEQQAAEFNRLRKAALPR